VKLGFHTLNTDGEVPVQLLAGWLEERGYESLWVPEHTHLPVDARTAYPGGGPIPPEYARIHDPLISLAVAAASTTNLRLGTAVLLPLQHDIVALAKSIATLDRVSDGRVLVGVGAGWHREELATHRSIPWAARVDALTEAVLALRALWTEDVPTFAGRYFSFGPLRSDLKPYRHPHPPVLVGSSGPRGLELAATQGDGWIPMDFRPPALPERLRAFREQVAEAGRDPDSVEITVVAGREPTTDALRAWTDLGVERVVLGTYRPFGTSADDTRAELDRWVSDLR
jgi:probable F420-dependent oxidoreductase